MTEVESNPDVSQRDMANALRALSMDAVEKAKSGHPGMPMGMADVATVLFTQHLKYDPSDPTWPDRDRFILSAGHGSMLLYALLYLTGYEDIDIEQIRNFRQLGSRTAGHPEYGHAGGIETTSGPLGQGLANGVGMALAERMLAARYGDDIVSHHTYVIASDGCLMEGISHEAISLTGHLKLNKLIVLFDDNGISIDGPTALTTLDDQCARFAASGWDTWSVDGHDVKAVSDAIAAAKTSDRPAFIACKTVIGFGAPSKQGTAATHGSPLGADEIAAARNELNWPHEPFTVPEDIRAEWRKAGEAGADEHNAWRERTSKHDAHSRKEFERVLSGELPGGWLQRLDEFKRSMIDDPPKLATRQASQKVLEVLVRAIPELVGGSADLTGSNLTHVNSMKVVNSEDYSGNYVHYGIREHGMAAAMNGIAQHGGIVPYGGSFLVFTDYCRPAIRLSALSGNRVIYVMSHDSIGLGEDGPTHQPVEHLASLRAIPNLLVFRPADAVETAESWALALAARHTPSVIVITRQGVPALRLSHDEQNLCALGAYVLAEASEKRQVSLLATGSEVGIAMEAREKLARDGIQSAVISMPCWELFEEQDASYQESVLGSDCPRVAVEAAVSQGWDQYIGQNGAFVGMNSFGASAPAGALYEHFDITAEAVATAARKLV